MAFSAAVRSGLVRSDARRKSDKPGLDRFEWQPDGWMLTADLMLKLGPMASIGCSQVVAGVQCLLIKTEWNIDGQELKETKRLESACLV